MSILGDRIKELRKEKGLNQTQLSESLNKQFGLRTDRVMISKWETGFQTPVMNTIKYLANYFNVTIDYLNGETEQKNKPTFIDESKLDKEIIKLFESATDSQKEIIMAYAQGLLDNRKD